MYLLLNLGIVLTVCFFSIFLFYGVMIHFRGIKTITKILSNFAFILLCIFCLVYVHKEYVINEKIAKFLEAFKLGDTLICVNDGLESKVEKTDFIYIPSSMLFKNKLQGDNVRILDCEEIIKKENEEIIID